MEAIAKTREEIDARLVEFVDALTAHCNEKNINKTLYKIVIEATPGKKYAKIVRYLHPCGQAKREAHGSVICFVRNDDGVIMKAASFIKVAPNGERGSIFAEDFDIGEQGSGRAVNQFGCNYVK
jgi:hypothetical protein